jgi:hypothetical protein
MMFPVLAFGKDYMDCPPQSSGAHVRPDNRYFDVSPRIVPSNTEQTIVITPLYNHVAPQDGWTYTISYTPAEQWADKSGWSPKDKEPKPLVPEDGKYKFKFLFEGEQEHTMVIEASKDDKKRVIGSIHVYSLDPDLFALRPFKGDFHMHSNRSDGVESPAYVAAACRRAGLDFMALSDHRTYGGSVEAQQAYKDALIDLRIYNAEECHAPGNPVHVLSFGANKSISEQYADEAAYRAAVAEIEKNLPETPKGVDHFVYASCLWEAERIREAGGMSMFCHAFWYPGNHFYAPAVLTDYLLEKQPFDALELISGMDSREMADMDTNMLQVARYQEERAKGRNIPICGISDTHGVERSEQFGRYYTVVFAPSVELSDLIAGIKGLRSVAVEAFGGEQPRPYGPFRLVKYCSFLLREVFPQHDELCEDEGRMMLEYARGDAKGTQLLKDVKGQTAELYGKYWAEK